MNKELLRKYNVPGPRYTSYPTVPYWNEVPPTADQWAASVKKTFDHSNEEGISLYLHLPFCERLCTFCGCNKRITVNHKVEEPYIETLLKEWQLYLDIFQKRPKIKEIHLGGGTPTFFKPENLERLISKILETADVAEDYEFGFEAHPNVTTEAHIKTLYDLGFKRISFGVQDFDPKVQAIINRNQSFEKTNEVTDIARSLGYTSVNYDLVFGLPLQTQDSVRDTVEKVKSIMPERIAYYSYAHVPWVSPGQRRYTEKDLPLGEEKRALYELGREMLEEAGYVEIGMDHFSLKEDSLYKAAENKTLHRNFMGYTPNFTELLIGLGVSSISDSWNAFMQNNKVVEEYSRIVNEGQLPILRGHILTDEDLVIRRHILNIMNHLETSWEEPQLQHPSFFEGLERMREVEEDGLVKIYDTRLEVTEKGIPFIRNICMAIDSRLWRKQPETRLFSQVI